MDWVAYHLGEWIQVRRTDIQDAWATNGGWEGWLQVELALYFKRIYGSKGFAITREEYIFHGTPQRVDLAIRPPPGDWPVLIEMKAEGTNRDANGFLRAMEQDLLKIVHAELKPQWRPARFYFWAFFCSEETRARGKSLMEEYARRYRTNACEVHVVDDIWYCWFVAAMDEWGFDGRLSEEAVKRKYEILEGIEELERQKAALEACQASLEAGL